MKIIILVFSIVFSFNVSAAERKINIDLDGATIAQIVKIVYADLFPADQYFSDPALQSDSRLIAFRFNDDREKFKPYFFAFLKNLGYSVQRKNNSDFLIPTPPDKKIVFSDDPNQEVFIYKPKFRSSTFLIESLSPLFTGQFTAKKAVSDSQLNTDSTNIPSDSAAAKISQQSDQIVFASTKKEVSLLKGLLAQIDTRIAQVNIEALVYEVSTSTKAENAISIVANLLKSRLSVSTATQNLLGDSLNFKSVDFTVIATFLNSDNRFKLLTNPSVRVESQKNAEFEVGEEVPTLASVSYQNNSNIPVQNVQYRNSGVIFKVQPVVKNETIDLQISQEISSFVNTTTGVNNSPTLTKRHIQTNVTAEDGEIIAIGGLRDKKLSKSKTGFSILPDFSHSKSNEESESEIILFLKVTKV